MIIALFIFALIISLLTIVVHSRVILLTGAVIRLVEELGKLLRDIKRIEFTGTDINQVKDGLIPDEWLKKHGIKN